MNIFQFTGDYTMSNPAKLKLILSKIKKYYNDFL